MGPLSLSARTERTFCANNGKSLAIPPQSLGVVVVVEKKTPGQLSFTKDESHLSAIRIWSVKLDFDAVPRDENKTLAKAAHPTIVPI
jgi:hypothetical protein